MVSEFILKWILGILTGVAGSILVFFRKQIRDFFRFKRKQKETAMLKDVNTELEEVEEEVEQKSNEFMKMLKDFRKEFIDLLAPMRDALLSSHYEALLLKCKKHIQAGQITFDELNLLEKDYATYSALGGNGHMEVWMNRVRQLKIV